MEDRVPLPVKVKWNMNDPDDVQLQIPAEDSTINVAVEALGASRFRLTNFPIGSCRLTFGDVVEAKSLPDGTLEYVRRVERSPFKIHSYILSAKARDGKPLRRVLDRVIELGGYWERVFGGMLLIALPKNVEWDPALDMERIMNKKSVWAVFVGVLFIIVVTTFVDILLHVTGVYPPMNQPIGDGLAALATAYRIVISIAGAWITARLAPAKPMKHALILGYVGAVLGAVGVVATWNAGLGPRWYPILLVVLAIPQCWVGGRLYEMQTRKRPRG